MNNTWTPAQLLAPGVGVILDTETTDLDGRIIEISIIDAATGAVLMDQLINPWDCSSTRPERPSPTTTPHERRLAREHHRAQLIDDQLRRRAETATCAARLAAEHADPDYQTRHRERRETLRATLRAAQQHVRTH